MRPRAPLPFPCVMGSIDPTEAAGGSAPSRYACPTMNDRKKPGTSEIVTARRGADGEWPGHPDAVREALASVKAASERARRWPQTPEGYVDTCAAMTVLAHSFPVIARDADGIAPWDVDRFLFWLCGPAPSSGALHAGRFLLSVWNPSTDWIEQAREKGIDGAGAAKRFDLFDSVGVWDDAHRLACMVWIEAPFWP